jgi:hypothetical protein
MADSDTKVQQFLLLAKSVRGRALCELINKATAEPGLFAFGELLDMPNIAEVRLFLVVCCFVYCVYYVWWQREGSLL